MKSLSVFMIPVLAGIASFGAAFVLRGEFAGSSHDPSATEVLPADAQKTGRSAEWSLALAERNPSKRVETLTEILSNEPVSRLIVLANQQTDDPEVLALILRQWARTDPRSAARWVLDKQRDGRVTLNDLGPVMEVWAADDPEALTAWFKEPGNSKAQYSHLPKLIGTVFSRDPAAALALGRDFPLRWKLPEESMAWIKADPAAAAAAFLALPEENYHYIETNAQAVRIWAEAEPEAATAWAAAQIQAHRTAGSVMLEKCLEVWAKKDPAAAAAYFRRLPPGELPAHGIVRVWAGRDPEAALQWASQANLFERSGLVHTAIAEVAASDFAKAAALVSRMEEGVSHDAATASLTRTWARQDPGAALGWASELPAGPARDKALADASSMWAEKDVRAAAAWAREAPPGGLPLKAYQRIMSELGRDPAAAYAWINELPEGPAGYVVNSMFSFPREAEVNAALAFPDGKYKARLTEQASTQFFQHGPDQALAWTLSLPDAGQRRQMRQIVENLEPTRQPSRWNQITAEKKAELLQRLKE